MTYLALDYGGTFVKYGILNDDAEILESGKVPAPLESVEQFAETTGAIYAPYKGKVEGVAISMPGIIDSYKGYARTAGAYTKMPKQYIGELLKPYVDVPISVENDGKSAILAEMWKGALKGVENGAAVIVGSGLGGGVLMDGKLRKGQNFASGEISALLTEPGNYSWGAFAAMNSSMSGFLLMMAQAKGMDPKDFEISGFMGGSDDDRKKISGQEVFEWIKAGDPVAVAVYEKWIQNLTLVLFNMKMTLDPQKIVVGGGVSRNPVFIEGLKAEWEKVMQMITMSGFPYTELEACRYTSDANLIGAVYNWKLLYKETED